MWRKRKDRKKQKRKQNHDAGWHLHHGIDNKSVTIPVVAGSDVGGIRRASGAVRGQKAVQPSS